MKKYYANATGGANADNQFHGDFLAGFVRDNEVQHAELLLIERVKQGSGIPSERKNDKA